MQDLSPWQPPHSGKLSRLTLRIAPHRPFLKTDLKLFLNNFLAIVILFLRFFPIFIIIAIIILLFLLSAFELRGY